MAEPVDVLHPEREANLVRILAVIKANIQYRVIAALGSCVLACKMNLGNRRRNLLPSFTKDTLKQDINWRIQICIRDLNRLNPKRCLQVLGSLLEEKCEERNVYTSSGPQVRVANTEHRLLSGCASRSTHSAPHGTAHPTLFPQCHPNRLLPLLLFCLHEPHQPPTSRRQPLQRKDARVRIRRTTDSLSRLRRLRDTVVGLVALRPPSITHPRAIVNERNTVPSKVQQRRLHRHKTVVANDERLRKNTPVRESLPTNLVDLHIRLLAVFQNILVELLILLKRL